MMPGSLTLAPAMVVVRRSGFSFSKSRRGRQVLRLDLFQNELPRGSAWSSKPVRSEVGFALRRAFCVSRSGLRQIATSTRRT